MPNVQLMPPNQQLDSGNTFEQIPDPLYTDGITKLVPDNAPGDFLRMGIHNLII